MSYWKKFESFNQPCILQTTSHLPPVPPASKKTVMFDGFRLSPCFPQVKCFFPTWFNWEEIFACFLFALYNAISEIPNSHLCNSSIQCSPKVINFHHQKFHLQTSSEQQPVSAEVSNLRCAPCPPGSFRQANSYSCSPFLFWRHKVTWELWKFI